jgi:E3 ubiquitin-protein ligase UBR4
LLSGVLFLLVLLLLLLTLQALPPMVVTYRLAGVDGEATEDTVETLQDSAAQVSALLLILTSLLTVNANFQLHQ